MSSSCFTNACMENSCVNGDFTTLNVASIYQVLALASKFSWEVAYLKCLAGRAASKAYDRSHRKTRIITGRPLTTLKW